MFQIVQVFCANAKIELSKVGKEGICFIVGDLYGLYRFCYSHNDIVTMIENKMVPAPILKLCLLAILTIIFCPQDGVILGADTRATEGPIVADKNCEKIHYMAPNIYCCGAGTAADTEAVTGSLLFYYFTFLFVVLGPELLTSKICFIALHCLSYLLLWLFPRHGQFPTEAPQISHWS